MLPNSDLLQIVLDGIALAGLINHFAHKNAGANADDELVASCHDYILDAVGDADRLAKIAAVMGIDLRSQLSVEQAQALEAEARLRRFGPQRN